MRLFNRAKEEDGSTKADTEVHAVPDANAEGAPMGAVPSAAEADARADDGAEGAVLDATVKEMSEKISRLSSSLESVSTERQTFEDKIERMEDRMRKLSSLTEMLSAQYNPFIGNAPTERGPLKADNVAGASAAMAPVQEAPPHAPPEPAEEPQHEVQVAPVNDSPEEADADPFDADAPAEGPFAEEEAPFDDNDATDAFDGDDATDAFDGDNATDAPFPEGDAADTGARFEPGWEPATRDSPHLDAVRPGFMTNMLLLNWSNMLLKATHSREGLQQVADYYLGLGWISAAVRDELVAYAEGLHCDEETTASRDWRADVDLHERSLLFIEKLKGGAP